MAGTRMGPGTRGMCCISGPVGDYVSVVVVERLSWSDAADVVTDRDWPDVDALRDQAQVPRARLEEIAREFANVPSIPRNHNPHHDQACRPSSATSKPPG